MLYKQYTTVTSVSVCKAPPITGTQQYLLIAKETAISPLLCQYTKTNYPLS